MRTKKKSKSKLKLVMWVHFAVGIVATYLAIAAYLPSVLLDLIMFGVAIVVLLQATEEADRIYHWGSYRPKPKTPKQ